MHRGPGVCTLGYAGLYQVSRARRNKRNSAQDLITVVLRQERKETRVSPGVHLGMTER